MPMRIYVYISNMSNDVGVGPSLVEVDELFRGFADPTRIRILNVLAAGRLCVCDIHEILSLPQPLVSRHLGRLRNSGLVEVERDSQFAHYKLARPDNPVHKNLARCVTSCFKGIQGLDDERAAAVARVKERKASPC
jgi:ArsR family transcriptional regulator, arsenate/arsenite/antimonite-responsive transcriptional repressor